MLSTVARKQGHIAIIGGGACGIALLHQLLEKFKLGKPVRSIFLFEKAKTIGPGLAYSEACQGTRLNMRTETMGLRNDNPSHFIQWMQKERPDVDARKYLFRTQYGEYLRSEKASAREEATKLGLNLQSVASEAVGLDRTDDGYRITTIDGQRFEAEDVVLALGNHMAPKHPNLKDELGYMPYPWPNKNLELIPSGASVGIVGSRLTGIDVALCLNDNGHTGPINLLSRSGRLPKVQSSAPSKEKRYRLFELAAELEKNPGQALPRLIEALKAQIEEKSKVDWNTIFNSAQDPRVELQNDIAEAERGNIHWQDVLNATSPVVERYWACFSPEEKQEFLSKWHSTWMVYRHAIPIITAKRVLNLMEKGQINVLPMNGRATKEDNKFVIPSRASGNNLLTDYLIEATGPECDPLRIESKLLHNCLGSQIIQADPFGGIKVDPSTLKASKGIYVVGSLTRGAHFYSTAIDRNVAHTDRIVDSIVGDSVRKPLHIAFFVGSDLTSQLMVSKLVPQLVNQGHIPYVFLPEHKSGKKPASFELKQLAFFERQLLQDHVIPFVNSKDSKGEKEDAPFLTLEQLRSRYGVLVEKVPDVNDEGFHKKLASHHIDIGLSIRCYQKFGKDIIRFFDQPGRSGLLNLHPGALPKYRGVMTMIRAMANSERDFGYSLHSINEEWDAGDLIDIQTGSIDYSKPMLSGLMGLYDVGGKVALDALEKIARGQPLSSVPQNEDEKGYYTFPTRKELDGYKTRGLRMVDPNAMRDFFVSAFGTPEYKDELKEVVSQAIESFNSENAPTKVEIAGQTKSIDFGIHLPNIHGTATTVDQRV